MKVLKITTHWTAEEADCIYQLLGELQSEIWKHNGEDIDHMYDLIREEQLEREKTYFDDIPF
jgi:hypothetical protein